jgi:DNA-directed RNA polymerase specialized sigma24 family protein
VLIRRRTVVIREAIRLDHASRRCAPLEAAGERPASTTTLTYEQAREALEVVAALPPRQREVFASHVGGLSDSGIAHAAGRSRRVVERHLGRAHRAVRARARP